MGHKNQHRSFRESDVHQRLREFIWHVGLNQNEFSRRVGFSSGALSKIMKENKSFGVDKLFQIGEVYPLLNLHWLLFGKGTMLFEREDYFDLPRQIEEQQKLNEKQKAKIEVYQEILDKLAGKFNEPR